MKVRYSTAMEAREGHETKPFSEGNYLKFLKKRFLALTELFYKRILVTLVDSIALSSYIRRFAVGVPHKMTLRIMPLVNRAVIT